MMTAPDATRLPISRAIPEREMELFVAAFLSRWQGNSQIAYSSDVRTFRDWCAENDLHPFDARRVHIEAYVRYLREDRKNVPSTINRRIISIRQFFEIAIDDDYMVKNPCRNVIVPRARLDLSKKVSMNREEVQRFLRAAYDTSASEYAMCALMAYLGLRVTEACNLDVGDVLQFSKGHRVVVFVGKGGDPACLPQPPVVMRALDAVIDELGRREGPLFLRRDGSRMTRRSADRVVKRHAKTAGIGMSVSPHTLRHSAITNAIDAGIPLREVQIAARHRDISTTIRLYDRGRFNLDTHASHGLAAYFGSVA
jgi:site-specific recombinase XerD